MMSAMSAMSSAVPERPLTGMMRPPSTAAIKGTGLKPVGTGIGEFTGID